MSEIEKRARELLAAEYSHAASKQSILQGEWGNEAVRAIAAALATQQPQGVPEDNSVPDYERMFVAACDALGQISHDLGCDPNSGGAAPILEAIAQLRRERDEWCDACYQVAGNAAHVSAHRLLRRNGDGAWVHDAKYWADGPAPDELIADVAACPDLFRIESAYSALSPPAAVPVAWDWLRGVIGGMPVRREPIGGQITSYVQRDEVLDWIEEGRRRTELASVAPLVKSVSVDVIDDIGNRHSDEMGNIPQDAWADFARDILAGISAAPSPERQG